MEYQNEHFLVQPYKAFKDFDDDSADGALIPYNFVGKTSEEVDVTMVVKMVTYDGLKIPVPTNEKTLTKEPQLLLAEPLDDEALKAPASKNRKQG